MADEMQSGLGRDAPAAGGLDIGSLLGSILAGNTGNAGGSGNTGVADAPASASPLGGLSSSAVSDGIGAVLSDPQMMAKLPEMIQMLKPLMGNLSGGGNPLGDAVAAMAKPQEKEDAPSKSEASVPASVSHGDKKKGCHERRIALLCALRPYLCPRRQEAIDYILRMDKMGKLFRNG